MENVYSLLEQTAKELRLTYTESSILYCIQYITMLTKWNMHTNLVGKQNAYEITEELCLDSIHLAYVIQQYSDTIQHIVDCGAGAGIPGIPFRCFYHHGIYSMIECRQKRILFIESVLRSIPLTRTLCKAGRVEAICPTLHIDALVSRAFMPPHALIPFAKQFINQGKYLILMLNTDDIQHEGYSMVYTYSYSIRSSTRYIILLNAL